RRSGGGASGSSAVATLEAGSWERSARAFGAEAMNASSMGTPGTRTPGASTRTRRPTRAGWGSARPAARQPPPRTPPPAPRRQPHHVRVLEAERVENVRRVEDEILHRLDRLQPFGGTEAGMHGHEDPAVPGQAIVDGHPPVGAGAVQVQDRAARPALEELDLAAAAGERLLPAARRGGVRRHVSAPAATISRIMDDLLSRAG